MRLEYRLRCLERAAAQRPGAAPCPNCGSIDPATKSGPLFPCWLRTLPDGVEQLICKFCCAAYRAVVVGGYNDHRMATQVERITDPAQVDWGGL